MKPLTSSQRYVIIERVEVGLYYFCKFDSLKIAMKKLLSTGKILISGMMFADEGK